jgi:hypothetical protein
MMRVVKTGVYLSHLAVVEIKKDDKIQEGFVAIKIEFQ